MYIYNIIQYYYLLLLKYNPSKYHLPLFTLQREPFFLEKNFRSLKRTAAARVCRSYYMGKGNNTLHTHLHNNNILRGSTSA